MAKRKKKRKKTTTSSTTTASSADGSNGSPLEEEVKRLSRELEAALARASDAENAEAVVNKGLLTARSVITQRDRALDELQTLLSTTRGEVNVLTEEKKRTDRRLTLLKTMSDNLREARDLRAGSERRVEEVVKEKEMVERRRVALEKEIEEWKEKMKEVVEEKISLEKDVERLNEQVRMLRDVKQKLVAAETEMERGVVQRAAAEKRGRVNCVRAAGMSAAVTLACTLVLRVTGGRRGES